MSKEIDSIVAIDSLIEWVVSDKTDELSRKIIISPNYVGNGLNVSLEYAGKIISSGRGSFSEASKEALNKADDKIIKLEKEIISFLEDKIKKYELVIAEKKKRI
jgi:hypothetical protein